MPKTPIFSQLFGRSPISPIQDHMKLAVDASQGLPSFFQAVISENWDDAIQVGEHICHLESKADDLKYEIRISLPRSLFMPLARSDLLELLQAQDKIPNRAKDIVGLCLGRNMEIPPNITETMLQFMHKSVEAPPMALNALNELNQLIGSGFSGREIELIAEMIEQLSKAEHTADDLQKDLLQELYKIEKKLDSVDVMFLYRCIDWIGDIADNAQSVGNRILCLIAK